MRRALPLVLVEDDMHTKNERSGLATRARRARLGLSAVRAFALGLSLACASGAQALDIVDITIEEI